MTVQTLVLFRHAKAEPQAPDDHARRLVLRGRRDAALVAQAAHNAGLKPDRVLVSDAARTLETWAVAAEVWNQPPCDTLPVLYHAPARRIGSRVGAAFAEGSACVVVIGHNPGLHDFAVEMLRHGARASPTLTATLLEGLPTAGLVWFERPGEDADWVLTRFITPAELGGGPGT